MSYEDSLRDLVEANEDYLVMTAENRGAIRNLPQILGDRFIDVGIAEQTMIGAAAGLALRSRKPIAHALATFLTMRAFEFIRTDVGIPALPVKLVGSFAGFMSEANGPTHQALEDVALMRGIPNMQVFCPADHEDMVIALPKILESDAPSFIRFNPLEPAVEHSQRFEIGEAESVSHGKDVAILVYGTLFREAYMAASLLDSHSISVKLLNLRTLKPIDEAALIKAAKKCELVVTIEDHFLTGGLYSILAETLLKNNISCKVMPFGLQERWFKPGLINDVLRIEGFTAEQIVKKIRLRLKQL